MAATRGEDVSTFSFKDSTMAKLHNDALVTELNLLKNISSRFVSDTFETVRDVSKALTPAVKRIHGSIARLLRLHLTVRMSNTTVERAAVFVPSTAEEQFDKQT